MPSTGLRWTRLCVASSATALFTTASLSAFATQKHALQPGESLDALARRYHVSVPDLIRANHIENQNAIPDGRVLTIPNPPRSLHLEPSKHRAAHVGKDSASVRMGPGLEYRRANIIYEGDAVVVTAERDGWAQIEAEGGVKGWMLKSLLHGTRANVEGAQTASRNTEPEPKHSRKPVHHAAMAAVEADRSRARKVARLQSETSTASHKRHAQQQEPVKNREGRVEREVATRPSHNSKHNSRVARIEHETMKARRHRAAEHSEPAVSSHKRVAKRHGHTEAAPIVNAKHHAAQEHLARAKQHKQVQEHLARAAKREQQHQAHLANVARRAHSHHAEEGGAQIAQTHHSRHNSIAQADAPTPSSDIVRTAYAYRGTPYVWGGERPGGFDCSGFTLHLMGKKGVSLPHSARGQFGMGHKVDRNGMKPGDLVFFHTVTPGISHVGMYVGSGKFVHASSRRSGGVRVDSLDNGYYSKAFRGARRMRKSEN